MEKDKKEIKSNTAKLAVVRIRGGIGIKSQITMTLDLLKLHKQNFCVVLDNTPSTLGMINKIKDYVTWGEINDDVLAQLREKRLRSAIGKDGKKHDKKYFRLHPPLKGFERKGIKTAFTEGGVLGYRKDKINDLIKRML